MASILETVGLSKGTLTLNAGGQVVVVHEVQNLQLILMTTAALFFVWGAGKAAKVW